MVLKISAGAIGRLSHPFVAGLPLVLEANRHSSHLVKHHARQELW